MKKKYSDIITKFQDLLRDGSDKDAISMYQEVGDCFYLSADRVRHIISEYYRGLVTENMLSYYNALNCLFPEKVDRFGAEFNLCKRESRFVIHYVKHHKP